MRAVKIDFVLCERKRELHKEIIGNKSEDGTMLNSITERKSARPAERRSDGSDTTKA